MTEIARSLFSWEGRLSRADFRTSILWLMLGMAIACLASFDPFADIVLSGFPPVPLRTALRAAVFPISCLTFLVVWYALLIKRAHDLGKSAVWILLPFSSLSLFFSEGDPGPNRYGPSPGAASRRAVSGSKASSVSEKAMGRPVPLANRSEQERATVGLLATVGVAFAMTGVGRPSLFDIVVGLALVIAATVLWRRWFSARNRR
jgi:uncharacterized membrane protein YhaH (DUF805 family)